MFDGFMSVLLEDVMRTPQTREELEYRRKFYGLDTPAEGAQRQHTRRVLPRFLRRKAANPS